MSAYIKTKADQKRRINKNYEEKLFSAAALVLPSVVIKAPSDFTESELVDQAVSLARSLLAELGHSYLENDDVT